MNGWEWPDVLSALLRLDTTLPPRNPEADMWLWATPELKGFTASEPVQTWADWLCAVWRCGQGVPVAVPAFPSTLTGEAWRAQADRAEDQRRGCPVKDWLTAYVAYLHACADLIDRFSGPEVRKAYTLH